MIGRLHSARKPLRLRLRYSDQNEEFGSALPRDGVLGTVIRQLALEGWGDDWFVLKLDEPFVYRRRGHDHVLIRSRWQGHRVGGKEPTSVFILLIPKMATLDDPLPKPEAFDHVAWGMVSRVID